MKIKDLPKSDRFTPYRPSLTRTGSGSREKLVNEPTGWLILAPRPQDLRDSKKGV